MPPIDRSLLFVYTCRRLIDLLNECRYEPCGSPMEASDVFCPMYPCEAQYSELSRAINDPSECRPIMMCEYAHAMGNSNGSLDEYWEVVRSKRQVSARPAAGLSSAGMFY